MISEGEEPDDAELVITSVKLLSGDIFGLEKYLSWGARISELTVKTYEEKREAMAVVSAYSREVGARRPVALRKNSQPWPMSRYTGQPMDLANMRENGVRALLVNCLDVLIGRRSTWTISRGI